jgi:ketosteroid isomerase-like protein
MPTPREIAEAFSGHRFREVYDALSADVRWTAVGQAVMTGRQAVIDVCESTLADLATTSTEFPRFVVVAEEHAAAVDVVARYVDAEGVTSLVSSCDVYEFREGLVATITSYAVELDAAAQA